MCTTGTKGFFGCITNDTPVAKKGLPASSACCGGRISSPWEPGEAPGGAAGKAGPCTAEKLQPPFSNSSPRSSLISPPPPPGRSHCVRRKVAPDPSSCCRPETIRSRRPRKRSSVSARNVVMRVLLPPCGDPVTHPEATKGPEALRRGALPVSAAEVGLLLPARDGRAHFGGEVLGLFRQALTQRVAGVPAHLDVLADHRHGGVDLVLDAPLAVRIAEEGLLEQAIVLVELLQLAGDDLLQHRLGLALLEKLRAVDALLLRQHILGNVLAAQPPRIAPGDLHGDVLHERLELLVPRGEDGLAVDLHQHA